MFDDYFATAQALLDKGTPFATALIVHAEKPTSGKVGDKAIITTDGTVHGWIGGSCARPTVRKEAVKAIENGESKFIRLSPNPGDMSPRDGLMDLPMTCFSGGTLEIYIEPQYARPRLLVIGDLMVAKKLIDIGKVMNYEVIAIDPDGDGSALNEAHHVLSDMKQIAEYARPDSYIVVATHGQFDEVAAHHALQSNAAYIGLVASSKRFQNVLEYLRSQKLDAASLDRIKAPAGIDIQARRGDEIALSIMAEIVQVRRNREEQFDIQAFDEKPAVAIDPICGMEVEIATAEITYEYEGTTYYFCCEGCRETFAKDPRATLAKEPPSGEAIDPICGMTVDIATAKFMSEYNGDMYYFCAAGCKMSFDKNPEEYLATEKG